MNASKRSFRKYKLSSHRCKHVKFIMHVGCKSDFNKKEHSLKQTRQILILFLVLSLLHIIPLFRLILIYLSDYVETTLYLRKHLLRLRWPQTEQF